MAKEQIYSMRKKLVNEKREALKKIPRESLVDMIDNYPNQRILNFDEEGNKRHFPIGKMADTIRDNDYKMTDNQYYTLLHQFTAITVPEMKVAGTTFHKGNPEEFKKALTERKGSRTQYDVDYILQPEPENEYDKNAVRIMVEKEDGELFQIGYVPANFVAVHPIREEMTVHGQMVDWSHGKFKNCSYDIAFDIEALDDRAAIYDKENGIVREELPFPITNMNIEIYEAKGKDHMKIKIHEGDNILLQKTYHEGSQFVQDGDKNPKGYPTRGELISELMDNYKVDTVKMGETNLEIANTKDLNFDLTFTDELDKGTQI